MAVEPEDAPPYVMREVVTVRNEIGWRITLSGSEEDFEQHLASFGVMLDSWRFR